MSVCSSEVCDLSEKKAALKSLASLKEDPNRASPVPFNKDSIVSEAFNASAQETVRQSENVETAAEGNVQITRKTKVEESFVTSQKMYSAEINTSSQSSSQIRASSPEMEQIMNRKQIYQSYHDTSRLTPNTLSVQQRVTQSERCLTPEIEHLMDKPHGSWSPMPPACMVRPISPHHIISYPPDIPPIPATLPHPRISTPEQFQEARETVERFVDHSKHAQQTQSASSGRTTQSYLQQSYSQQSSGQQYTPRYDMNQSFSAYPTRGNSDNPSNQGNRNNQSYDNPNGANAGNSESETPGNPGNHGSGNPGNPKNGNKSNGSENGYNNGNPHNPGSQGNGKFGNTSNGNGNPGTSRKESMKNGNTSNRESNEKEEKPTVTEPDETEEKYSRKSSRTDQSQKSSFSEEESSRRVFSDFGGPQVSSSVQIESTTEGGIQKTSVTKSDRIESSSCEFESSRKSTILKGSDNIPFEERQSFPSSDSKKPSYPKFTAGDSSMNEEEMVTKSQVEEIIKQELNKVFQMAQTMENTSFGDIHNQKYQKASSEQTSTTVLDKKAIGHVEQISDQSFQQKSSSSQYSDKIAFTGEVIKKTGKLTSGLTIAPDRPFTPQALESNYPLPYQNMPSDFPPPRPLPEAPAKKSYIPITGGRDTPLIQALTIASDRPYSPLPTATAVETPPFITPPKPKQSSMLEALTTAPTTPFHFEEASTTVVESGTVKKTSKTKSESAQKYAPRPTQLDFKPISATITEPQQLTGYVSKTETHSTKSFPPVTDDLKSVYKSDSKVQSFTAESERQQTETSRQTVTSSHQRSSSTSRAERPVTPSGLHPPSLLPYYQQHIGEIPLAHRSNSPVPHQIKAPEITPPRAQSVPHHTERRSSVKAMSEAYVQQIEALNNKQIQPAPTATGTNSVSYVSAGAYSSGSINKTYSYEQEHKSLDVMGYHASPLAGKVALAGEKTLPKCSSPVLGKLDHTKQVFKPSIPVQQPISAFQSPVAEQANLKQAPPFFIQEKDKSQVPWLVVKGKDDKEIVNKEISFKLPQPTPPQPTSKFSLPSFPNVNKTLPAFPEPSKPFSLPGVMKPPSTIPDAGPGGAPKGATTAGTSAPRRGRGVLNAAVAAGTRVPLCGSCNSQIRGPFITALGKIWCPDHFVCVNAQCRRPLQDIGFVEEEQGLYCEYCFEQYLAPSCNKCNAKVKGDCLNAIGKHFHPECFTCAYCGKLFGNNPFFLEDALPYCEADWNELFTTKCFSCGFPIEAGDRWVEALNNNYHSQCFNCTMCKKNLEGQSFFAKGGRPFCKNHAR